MEVAPIPMVTNVPPIAGLCILATLLIMAVSALAQTDSTSPAEPAPIIVHGPEQGQVNLAFQDGGLKPVAGVHNFQVFRASRDKADVADQDGWTYAHHQDLACWKGRLYAAWAMTPRDEGVPPHKVLYATSTDGIHWSAPADLFPRDLVWPCRFYFYLAGNGRMLAFSAGKMGDGPAGESLKKVLLVREITGDHSLGDIFTLVGPLEDRPASFETAKDPGLVAACREAAGNNLLLEQQDFGVFLGDRRMKWHGDSSLQIPGGFQFGKAFCFYHCLDGTLMGLCKMGFATVSQDDGKTWSQPVQPPTLIAGGSKIWGQRTSDGRFALVYNPDRKKRYPLVLVHGDDGREFRDMRVVHGELPPRRYVGFAKGMGPQYMRGLAEWANDGTFADKQALWIIYSVSKEDIWVSRVPLPVKPDETAYPSDDFEKIPSGGIVPGWNIYSPLWAPVAVVADAGKRCLELRDGDPFDYARAVRLFPAAERIRTELRVKAAQTNARLDVDLCDATGRRPVRVAFAESGIVQAADGASMVDVGTYEAGAWMTIVLTTDLAAGTYTVQLNGGEAKSLATAEKDIGSVERLSLRTGPWRGRGDEAKADVQSDVPLPMPAVFHVDGPIIRPLN